MLKLESVDLYSPNASENSNKEINKHKEYWLRKTDRPDYETLCKEIEKLGFTGTGKKYGVSDNAIRKWKKNYETQFRN